MLYLGIAAWCMKHFGVNFHTVTCLIPSIKPAEAVRRKISPLVCFNFQLPRDLLQAQPEAHRPSMHFLPSGREPTHSSLHKERNVLHCFSSPCHISGRQGSGTSPPDPSEQQHAVVSSHHCPGHWCLLLPAAIRWNEQRRFRDSQSESIALRLDPAFTFKKTHTTVLFLSWLCAGSNKWKPFIACHSSPC